MKTNNKNNTTNNENNKNINNTNNNSIEKKSIFNIDLKQRFKSFKWNHYLLLVFLFLFEIVLMWLFIGMSISISKNISMFEGLDKPIGSNDIVIYVLVILGNILLLFLLVYYLLFSKVITIKPEDKVIHKGRILKIDDGQSQKVEDKTSVTLEVSNKDVQVQQEQQVSEVTEESKPSDDKSEEASN